MECRRGPSGATCPESENIMTWGHPSRPPRRQSGGPGGPGAKRALNGTRLFSVYRSEQVSAPFHWFLASPPVPASPPPFVIFQERISYDFVLTKTSFVSGRCTQKNGFSDGVHLSCAPADRGSFLNAHTTLNFFWMFFPLRFIYRRLN